MGMDGGVALGIGGCGCGVNWYLPVVPYENRMCLVCLDKIGDEFHFLLECPRYQSLRSRLIGRYYWNRPSMLKLQQLLNSTCTNVIRAVAKFVYKAFNDLWFYVIHVCRFCTFWYPVAILCNCVRHADQMFLSRKTFVRARGPKTIIKSLNPWILILALRISHIWQTISRKYNLWDVSDIHEIMQSSNHVSTERYLVHFFNMYRQMAASIVQLFTLFRDKYA